MKVFVLQHVREIAAGREDTKFLGAYSTEEPANEAIQRAVLVPGFGEAPHGFHIDAYEVDKDYWTEGYVTAN